MKASNLAELHAAWDNLQMEKLNARINRIMSDPSIAALQRSVGGSQILSRPTLDKGMHENVWSNQTRSIIKEKLGIETEDTEFTPTSKEHIVSRRPKTLDEAFGEMEAGQGGGRDTDDLFAKVFDALVPGKPSYMVVITANSPPTTFNRSEKKIRGAVLGAVERNLRLIYIVPSERKLKALKLHGITTHPHRVFIDGYRNLVEDIGHENSSRLIQGDRVHIASPHYVTALIGETVHGRHHNRRIVERGPVQGGHTQVLKADSDHMSDWVKYSAIMAKKHLDTDFGQEFIDRLGYIDPD